MQFVADFPFYFYFYSSQPSEVGLGKIQETTNRYILSLAWLWTANVNVYI